MKTRLFLLIVLFSLQFTVTIQAQTGDYVSLAACNNDTLKYVDVNFVQNKKNYIGQPFSKFLEDFELNVYLKFAYSGRTKNSRNSCTIWGLQIVYIPEPYFYLRDNRPFYTFYFEFEAPYTVADEIFKGTIWGSKPNYYNHFFKDCIIKDMEARSYEETYLKKNFNWKEYKLDKYIK